MEKTKTCRSCEQAKPLDQFYGLGYGSKKPMCKECTVAYQREYRAQNIDEVRARDRERARTPKRKAHSAANLKRWRDANPDKVNKDRRDHPEKYKARTAVGNAIRDGKLVRQPCEGCQTTDRVQAHHHDYSKPLEVRWLCRKCHGKEHESDWLSRRK
jgi:hypothetical protein